MKTKPKGLKSQPKNQDFWKYTDKEKFKEKKSMMKKFKEISNLFKKGN